MCNAVRADWHMKKGLGMSFIKNKPPKSYGPPSLRTVRSGPRPFDLPKVRRARKLAEAEGAETFLTLRHRSSLPHTEEASNRCLFKGRENQRERAGANLIWARPPPSWSAAAESWWSFFQAWTLEGQVCFYGFQVSVTQTVYIQCPKAEVFTSCVTFIAAWWQTWLLSLPHFFKVCFEYPTCYFFILGCSLICSALDCFNPEHKPRHRISNLNFLMIYVPSFIHSLPYTS